MRIAVAALNDGREIQSVVGDDLSYNRVYCVHSTQSLLLSFLFGISLRWFVFLFSFLFKKVPMMFAYLRICYFRASIWP